MTLYTVERRMPDGAPVQEDVRAQKVDIKEGGILAFYNEEQSVDDEESEVTLQDVTGDDELIIAYKMWDAFGKADSK